ncbi:MAG: methyltransferase domain-containing protein [Polyangiaceae bacterium]
MEPRPAGRTYLTFAPEACRRLVALLPDEAPEQLIARAEAALGQVPWHNEVGVATWLASEPFHALVALASLADDPLSIAAERIAAVFPELAGLVAAPDVVTYEHAATIAEGTRATPLLDQTLRALAWAAPKANDLDRSTRALVTIVLAFSDVSKGGTPAQRAAWAKRLGVDGTVHNEDSAVILDDVFRRVLSKAPLSEDGRLPASARALCAATGLVGMRVRGEVSRDALAPLHDFFRGVPHPESLREGDTDKLAAAWAIINRAETASVRPGLLTPELEAAFAEEEHAILLTAASIDLKRSPLSERIARMRGGALMRRESPHQVERVLDTLRGARRVLEGRLARAQIWYAEAALGALSLNAAVRVLLYCTGAALRAGIDPSRTWHLDLLGLVSELREPDGTPRRYPSRLLEAILESTRYDKLMQGLLAHDESPLLTLPSTKGGEQALRFELTPSREASALLTLLEVYETKAAAEFHATLKALTDLYGLRKDDFDRVANEASYLAAMNGARYDKARMLDFVIPGTIVEVGPGGGVVLELMAERFPGSRIVGIDSSLAVVEAFRERQGSGEPPYEIIHGDAFRLAELFADTELTTVVFCSVLHEIFSYCERGDPPKRFRLEAVDDIVAAAFRALGKGGRIVIRDGVMPKHEPRVLELLDASWARGFRAFARDYEPRRIAFEELAPAKVKLDAADLYEFLTTFTWGPASYPYEIREQRAVLPRDEYVARLVAACARACPEAKVREIKVGDLASYLQPGYPEHLARFVRITNEAGHEVPMPDVNGVWVIEKG